MLDGGDSPASPRLPRGAGCLSPAAHSPRPAGSPPASPKTTLPRASSRQRLQSDPEHDSDALPPAMTRISSRQRVLSAAHLLTLVEADLPDSPAAAAAAAGAAAASSTAAAL